MNRLSDQTGLKIFVGVLIALAAVAAVISIVRLDTFGEKSEGLGKKLLDDIKELSKIDPNLILYEESGKRINTGFTQSRALAVDSKGAILVAGDRAVRIFDPNDDTISQISLSDQAGCVAVGSHGRIYVGVENHVEVYNADAQRLARWNSLGNDALLTGIAVSNDGIFVADAGNRIVIRYDVSGQIVKRIGQRNPETNVPGFVVPSASFDLALSNDGLLRVVNPGRLRVEAYTLDGDFEFAWGKASASVDGFCGCCNPANIAVLPGGGFVTVEKGLVRVKIYDSEGTFVGVVAGPEQLLEEGGAYIHEFPEQAQGVGFDVAVDADGRIFVLDTIKNVVRIYTKKEVE
ncbi:MAG: NHL repeat-containing protein [Sedimentisphaerales bacterium]|nr:NHL repeat-containing protein [Sedimentisphaerales bacterium]